jgi:hypothetical protein
MRIENDQHWERVASGRRGNDDTGSYFRGRTGVLDELAAFLQRPSAPRQPNVLLLAGPAGSGKSAVLSRAVLGPAPIGGGVDAALDACGATVPGLVRALLAAVDAPVGAAAGVVSRLTAAADLRQRPLTVLLDSIERAEQPESLLRDLIAPLAVATRAGGGPACTLVLAVRTMIATSPESGEPAGEPPEQLGLDGMLRRLLPGRRPAEIAVDDGTLDDDLTAYLTALAGWPGTSPYAADAGAARALAESVTKRLSPDFEIAGALVDALRRSGTEIDIDIDDQRYAPLWLEPAARRLAEDVMHVVRVGGATPAAVVAALRAIALAGGDGVPADAVWAQMTSAVADADVPGVARLLDTLLITGTAGLLCVAPTADGPLYAVNYLGVAYLLAEHPGVLWAALPGLAGPDVTAPSSGSPLFDPPTIVHARITRAFIAAMVRDGIIAADPPEPAAVSRRGDQELQWLRWEATADGVDGHPKRKAARELHSMGHVAAAVSALTTMAEASDNKINDRYEAAADLWRIEARPAALHTYRLLLEEPQADRAAMQQAIDGITAGAAPPPVYNTPGIPMVPPPQWSWNPGPAGPI